jgi:DNA invertase Pin-like site-specific DNA recombinase
MPKAYSYLRFSTPEQSQGDSTRRQTALAQEYVVRHGLDLDDSLTYRDEGISAFRGKNAEAGRLGDFLAAVREGLVPRGSYLLVESLDRISRQAARKALRVLEDIVDEDITVVTLTDNRVYTREALDMDPTALLMSIVIFIRANEESATKAKRLKAAWVGKRMRALERPTTSVGPAWLRLDKQTGTWTVLEESVRVVRRIFRDYLGGQGVQRITVSLNQENVPTLSRETKKGPRRAPRWHASYVKRILGSPAVIGTYTPTIIEHENGRRVRKAQSPIPGYFPPVMDEETFRRVQALQRGTSAPLRGRNAGGEVRNLLGGLAACAGCGSPMCFKSTRPYTYLTCLKARAGAGCKYTSVPYPLIEGAFLRDAERLLACAPAGEKGSAVDAEVRELEAALEGSQDRLEALMEGYVASRSPMLLKEIRACEEAQAEYRKRLGDRHMWQAAVAGPFVAKRIQDLEEALKSEHLDRRRVNALLRTLFRKVTVDPSSMVATFIWKHGGEDDVLFGFPQEEVKAA